MDIVLQIIAIGLFGLGGLIALVNGWIFASQLFGKHIPSGIPFLGGFMLFLGGLIYPDPSVRRLAWLGLIADYGCFPYLMMASISTCLKVRRYSAKNRLLDLCVETPTLNGSVFLYPTNVAMFHYSMKDGMGVGTIIMEAKYDINMQEIELSIEDALIRFICIDGNWKVQEERGWDEKKSLKNALVQEKPPANQ
jgi:hypothetical protein